MTHVATASAIRAFSGVRHDDLFETTPRFCEASVQEIQPTDEVADDDVLWSPSLDGVLKTIQLVAPLTTTVLITGESGTGKEIVARTIHAMSPRAARPMIALNCAAIPETLLESELFGHERGAFTDAKTRKLGQFELANHGTLFLDEIGDMSPVLQTKLLRAIEQGEFIPIGAGKPVRVDVRIVTATNANLEAAVKAGRFRADLYYRLNIVRIELPPLRARRRDLPDLIQYLLRQKVRMYRRPLKQFSAAALEALLRYPWPGNVRELGNLIEQMLVVVEGDVIEVDDLPRHVTSVEVRRANAFSLSERILLGQLTLEQAVANLEREVITTALERMDGNITRAAELLGATRRILRYRMAQLGIEAAAAAA